MAVEFNRLLLSIPQAFALSASQLFTQLQVHINEHDHLLPLEDSKLNSTNNAIRDEIHVLNKERLPVSTYNV